MPRWRSVRGQELAGCLSPHFAHTTVGKQQLFSLKSRHTSADNGCFSLSFCTVGRRDANNTMTDSTALSSSGSGSDIKAICFVVCPAQLTPLHCHHTSSKAQGVESWVNLGPFAIIAAWRRKEASYLTQAKPEVLTHPCNSHQISHYLRDTVSKATCQHTHVRCETLNPGKYICHLACTMGRSSLLVLLLHFST